MQGRSTRASRLVGTVAAGAALLVSALAAAQVDTATLTVRTTAGSDLPLSGVAVVAVNVETGLQRTATTDARGTARLLALAPGSYRVEARLDGFEPGVDPGCALRIGQGIDLTFTMRPLVAEAIEVSGEAVLVEVERRDAAANVVPEQIRQLPVIDRKFERLAFITPGVQADRVEYFDREGGPVIGAAATGAEATVLIDGVELTDPITGLARQRLSQDAVREFRVSRQGFDAELGGSANGVVSIVTHRGGNDLRGSVYGFYRADALRAQGELELEDADFTRIQLGVALGGPLVRDRTHYFLSLEHLDENKVAYVRPGGSLTYLAADVPAPVEQTSVVLGLDHRFGDSSTGAARFFWERYRQDNYDVGGVRDESNGWSFDRDAWTLLIGHTWVIGDNRLNQLGAQVARREGRISANSETLGEWFSLGASLQTGGTIFGPDGRLEGDFAELRETFSWQPGGGRHRLSIGLSYEHVSWEYPEDRYGYGLMVYGDDAGPCPCSTTTASARPVAALSNDYWGAFVHDDWLLRDNLTVSLGVRYDLETDGNNRGFTHPRWGERRRDTDNLQPRLGLSWDLRGDGRDVLRAAVGRYVGRDYLLGPAYELMFNGEAARLLRRNVSVPDCPDIWLDPGPREHGATASPGHPAPGRRPGSAGVAPGEPRASATDWGTAG